MSDFSNIFHLTVEHDGVSAVELLTEASQLSRQAIKQAMQKGAVWLTRGKQTQRMRRASKKLKPGDELHFYYNPQVLNDAPQSAQLVADEGAYSVWNKPYGMLSQGSKWGDHCTIYRWAEQNLQPQRPAFIVHRLDRAASGLMMLAHSKKMAASLSALFEQRKVEKHYQVWVVGDFSGQVSGPWKRLTIDEPLAGKNAVSHFSLLEYDKEKNRSLLDVEIETGRKHQIRRHLAGAGFPVVGDRLYGEATEGDEDLQLQAVSLAFQCPASGKLCSYKL